MLPQPRHPNKNTLKRMAATHRYKWHALLGKARSVQKSSKFFACSIQAVTRRKTRHQANSRAHKTPHSETTRLLLMRVAASRLASLLDPLFGFITSGTRSAKLNGRKNCLRRGKTHSSYIQACMPVAMRISDCVCSTALCSDSSG
ncbi:hypothetical protein TRVL_10204 [Trypanosoma vivax]|nr:hypothetical protein TRVL_10204 [Trypanosoma vivax]